jgi:hypothetical protein
VGAADRHDAAHLFPAAREHDRGRFRRVKRQPIALVDEQLLRTVEAAGRTHDGFEFTDQGRHPVILVEGVRSS